MAAASGKTFDCVSPIDGRVLTKVAECDAEDVNRAVAAARAVFEKGSWSACHPGKRKKVMLKFAELMAKHKDELALLETLDMGKPISASAGGDIPGAIQAIQWYAEAADKVYDEVAPYRPDSVSLITREPIGVVAAVVPWNYPLMMASWKLGPALATGNSIILKPAEQSPLTALRIAELAAEAGIPDGVLQVLPGFGETAGQALGRHMDVDMVAFTGSTVVGKYFLRYAGESNMKHVSLETGGKSPNIVFADAGDLDHIAKVSADGVFYNAGPELQRAHPHPRRGEDQGRVRRARRQACQALDAGRPARPRHLHGCRGRCRPDEPRAGLHRRGPQGRCHGRGRRRAGPQGHGRRLHRAHRLHRCAATT